MAELVPLPEGKEGTRVWGAGGGGHLNVKVTKRHLKILSLVTHTCGNPGDKRRGRPFVKVSLQSAALGEKYSETMEALRKEQRQEDYFYPPPSPTFTCKPSMK